MANPKDFYNRPLPVINPQSQMQGPQPHFGGALAGTLRDLTFAGYQRKLAEEQARKDMITKSRQAMLTPYYAQITPEGTPQQADIEGMLLGQTQIPVQRKPAEKDWKEEELRLKWSEHERKKSISSAAARQDPNILALQAQVNSANYAINNAIKGIANTGRGSREEEELNLEVEKQRKLAEAASAQIAYILMSKYPDAMEGFVFPHESTKMVPQKKDVWGRSQPDKEVRYIETGVPKKSNTAGVGGTKQRPLKDVLGVK